MRLECSFRNVTPMLMSACACKLKCYKLRTNVPESVRFELLTEVLSNTEDREGHGIFGLERLRAY